MGLDVVITQGSYWNGGQIPYWLYMIFAILPITGLIGGDHLLLRSPVTALLKLISIVPLFGFWYFYDIAQALGERELVEKNGIGVPFYGPVGIGAGIFIEKDTPFSPPDTPRPWRYLLYVLTTALFTVFPINKLIIGDYFGAIAQFIMYLLFPLTFLAIGWGFYDLYRILFDPRGVFEEGPSRVLPASWILGANFDRGVMGPAKGQDIGLAKLIKKAYSTGIEVADAGLSVVSSGAQTEKSVALAMPTVIDSFATSAASLAPVAEKQAGHILHDVLPRVTDKAAEVSTKVMEQIPQVVNKAAEVTTNVVQAVPNLVNNIVNTVNTVTQQVPDTVKKISNIGVSAASIVPNTVQKVSNVGVNLAEQVPITVQKISNVGVNLAEQVPSIAKPIVDSATAVAETGSKAVNIVRILPNIGKKISEKIGDPNVLIQEAKESASHRQSGGSLFGMGYDQLNGIEKTADSIRNQANSLHNFEGNMRDKKIPIIIDGIVGSTGKSIINTASTTLETAGNTVNSGLNSIENMLPNSQQGGALISMTPSVSTTVVLFSVALLAFGGYVAYTLRNNLTKAKEEDDSPPNARPVRRTS
jgi:hypothetical protein